MRTRKMDLKGHLSAARAVARQGDAKGAAYHIGMALAEVEDIEFRVCHQELHLRNLIGHTCLAIGLPEPEGL